MSEGAANEARVVISTDYETYKDFVEFAKKGNKEVGESGKSAFGDIGKSASDFVRGGLQGMLMGAGMQLFDAIVTPLRKGFGQLIQDAEQFRGVVARIAVSAGEDFGKIEKELDALSRKTGLDVDKIGSFVEGVRRQTGNRKAALGAVEGARKEALARGGELGDLTGEVGDLQRRWKVDDVEKFYNQERSRAAGLGLDPNLAATTSSRMRGMYENAGMPAEAVSRWSNTLLKASGGDAQRALQAGQEFNSLVQGPQSRGYLEQTLGLKQGELMDKNGLPDVARAIDLMMKFQHGKRGQKGLEFIARQHMSPAVAQLFSRGMPEITAGYEAQNFVETGAPLQETADKFDTSEEGQAALTDQRIKSEDRTAGKWYASWRQRVRKKAGGGTLGWLKPLTSAEGVRTVLGEADPEELKRHDEEGVRKHQKALQEMQARKAREASGGGASFMNPSGGVRAIPLGGAAPSAPAWQDPKQLAQEQGKALGDSLQKGNALPVVIRGPVTIVAAPPPAAGQGGQRR